MTANAAKSAAANSTPVIIAGLGNPGNEYAATRHNAGFRVLDALATREKSAFSADNRHRCENVKITLAGRTVWLLKPLTFMNESGQSLGPFCAFHKIPPANLLVVYDDITLAPGLPKLTTGGGDGGHNGIKSILQHLSNTFARYRVGIGPKQWQGQNLADHVLGKLTPDEQLAHQTALPQHLKNIELWLRNGTEKAQTLINRRPPPPKSTESKTPETSNFQLQTLNFEL